MATKRYVIIGNGPAGQEAAFTLRKAAPDARISVIGKEAYRCYQPNLLPQFVTGQCGLSDLYLKPLEAYQLENIRLRLGQEVTRVDLTSKELLLAHNETVKFDGLILAVGGKARIPERYQIFSDLFFTLKTIQDAQRWQSRLEDVNDILLIGGDLTSLGMAKALLKINKKVSMVFTEDAFWPNRDTDEVAGLILEKLSAAGVQCIPGQLRSIIRYESKHYEVVTDQGSTEVGLVGAFFGLRPDVSFLAGSGLVIERGILVDEYLGAGVEGIYATGDCAQVYSPELKDYWVSIGYKNALNLGRIAALNLAGGHEQVKTDPESIFSDQGVQVNTSWWAEF